MINMKNKKLTDFEKTSLQIIELLKGKSLYEVKSILSNIIKILKMRLTVI